MNKVREMEFKEFISELDHKGLLVRIHKPVDTKYEISTVMKHLDGRPLLFENVKNQTMPVVANICSTRQLVAIGLGCKESKIIGKLADAVEHPEPPKVVKASGYDELPVDLTKLPILTHYAFDGGPYISSGIAVVRDKELGVNASYHRAMVLGKDKIVMRILPRHLDEFLKRGDTKFAFCVGNSIPVLLGAAISAELGKSELDIANSLAETTLTELGGHTVPQSELVLIAEITGETRKEGPFLDLTETPDIVREQRVARITNVFARKGAMYHALLPGGLEHKVLMGMPREPTIFREVNKVVECRDVLVTPGGCSWLHGAVSIRKKHPDDARKAIEAAFRGHSSMKHVFILDDDIDIHNPNEIEWAMATRFQGDRAIVVKPKEKGSSLDPSSNLETRETTKVGFDLTIPSDRNPEDFRKPPLPMKLDVNDYLK